MELKILQRDRNKTLGINEIYKIYKVDHKQSLKLYTDIYNSYKETIDTIEKDIYSINNKLGIYVKPILEIDNILRIKEIKGAKYNPNDGYILLLRGYYKKLNKVSIQLKDYEIKILKLKSVLLTKPEFKYLYKLYNFHMSNAVLMGYRKFYLGGILGRIVLDTFNNKGRKRGIDWGESNKIKAELLKQGKSLYSKTNKTGEKWLITYNHKEFDVFWKWKSMSTTLVKTHMFKPTNYRPTIIYDNNGKSLTTKELELQSTINDVLSYKIGNTQKSTIITNLDDTFFSKYNDDYVLKDYNINYKTDL